MVLASALGRQRLGGSDRAADHDVAEAVVQLGDLRARRRLLQADDEQVADPAHGVVVTEEAEQLRGGLVHVCSHLVERMLVKVHEPVRRTSPSTKRCHPFQ